MKAERPPVRNATAKAVENDTISRTAHPVKFEFDRQATGSTIAISVVEPEPIRTSAGRSEPDGEDPVFLAFEAPFVRILALHSNTLEDPGVISSQGTAFPEIGESQLAYLRAALTHVRTRGYTGALILAHHHPTYTMGSKHGSSKAMRIEIDTFCEETGA
jgi:hypothetical protein